MNKTIKIASILMIALILIMTATPVFAGTSASVIDGLDQEIKQNIDDPSDGTLKEKVGKVIGVLQWIGIIAGVAIIAIFGIKYMMGSLEEKAEYKKTMIPFVVGAVVLMLAPQIAKLIFSIVE